MTIEGETYYKISSVDQMRPFFMSIVSHSDHWMFLASNGGLSAGRVNSDHALFPYYTDDKITEAAETTGSKTIVLVEGVDRRMLWQPFSEQNRGVYSIERNLYKNAYGNKVIFEEVNHDLALTFRYQWSASERYGFVRQARLESSAADSTKSQRARWHSECAALWCAQKDCNAEAATWWMPTKNASWKQATSGFMH